MAMGKLGERTLGRGSQGRLVIISKHIKIIYIYHRGIAVWIARHKKRRGQDDKKGQELTRNVRKK